MKGVVEGVEGDFRKGLLNEDEVRGWISGWVERMISGRGEKKG